MAVLGRNGTAVATRWGCKKSLDYDTIREYLVHYHQERNHQGLANRILVPSDEVGRASGEIRRRDRLGGLLRYYYREAA